jgi:hypothetical protein
MKIDYNSNLLIALQNYTCLPANTLKSLIKSAPTSYRIYTIKKKNGHGTRLICHPSRETKMLQYFFLDSYFSQFKIHDAAKGYKKGEKSPLLKNALAHVNFDYSIHLDFKNFFPSIVPKDVEQIVAQKYDLTSEDKNIIRNVCFICTKGQYTLTIGAPVSPIISNIIMYDIDETLQQYAQSTNGSYTRYADDLWYSSNNDEDCRNFLEKVRKIIETSEHPKLSLNEKKTRFYKSSRPRYITGLLVTENREIKVPRSKKRYVRSLINKTELTNEEQKFLHGYISFIMDNEPLYVNKLILRYGAKFYNKYHSRISNNHS